MQQGDDGRSHERVRMTGTFGTLDRAEPVHRAPAPPEVPGAGRVPAGHAATASPLAAAIAVLDRLDARIDPSTAGFAVGRPTGRGVIRAWLRMRDGREPDAAMLPYAVDALMPVSFDLGAPGWAPTMELTGQTLGRPGARLAAARDDDRHRGGRPAGRGRLRVGLHRPARRPVPTARRGAAARRTTSLLGCPTRARPSTPSRAWPSCPASRSRSRRPARRAPGCAGTRPCAGGSPRPRPSRGCGGRPPAASSRARRCRSTSCATSCAAPSTWSASPDPVEVTMRGVLAATAETEHVLGVVLTAPAAGAGAAAHGGGDAGWSTTPRSVGRGVAGEACGELTDLGPAPDAAQVAARLRGGGRRAARDAPAAGGRRGGASCTPSWPRCGPSCGATRSSPGPWTGPSCTPAGSTRPVSP